MSHVGGWGFPPIYRPQCLNSSLLARITQYGVDFTLPWISEESMNHHLSDYLSRVGPFIRAKMSRDLNYSRTIQFVRKPRP